MDIKIIGFVIFLTGIVVVLVYISVHAMRSDKPTSQDVILDQREQDGRLAEIGDPNKGAHTKEQNRIPGPQQSHSAYMERPATNYNSSTTNQTRRSVTFTQRNELTSWALHKQPGDIQQGDYILPPSGDVVIHREGGVVKIVKGPGAGRVLSEWELKDYLDSL